MNVPKETIKSIINYYFNGLSFSKADSKDNYILYVAKIYSAFADDSSQYIIAMVPQHLSIKDRATINELDWHNIQARKIKKEYLISSQQWNIPRDVLPLNFILKDRSSSQTSYKSREGLNLDLLLLHNPRKKSEYQYPNNITFLAALGTYSCVLSLISTYEPSTIPRHIINTKTSFKNTQQPPNYIGGSSPLSYANSSINYNYSPNTEGSNYWSTPLRSNLGFTEYQENSNNTSEIAKFNSNPQPRGEVGSTPLERHEITPFFPTTNIPNTKYPFEISEFNGNSNIQPLFGASFIPNKMNPEMISKGSGVEYNKSSTGSSLPNTSPYLSGTQLNRPFKSNFTERNSEYQGDILQMELNNELSENEFTNNFKMQNNNSIKSLSNRDVEYATLSNSNLLLTEEEENKVLVTEQSHPRTQGNFSQSDHHRKGFQFNQFSNNLNSIKSESFF